MASIKVTGSGLNIKTAVLHKFGKILCSCHNVNILYKE